MNKSIILLTLSLLFSFITVCGAGYVLLARGEKNAGYIVQLIAILFNINVTIQGGPATALNIAISVGYIAFWLYYAKQSVTSLRERRNTLLLILWGAVFLTAFLTMIVYLLEVNWIFITPFTIIFLTPLYGLRGIMPYQSYTGLFVSILLLSFVFFCGFIMLRLKQKTHNHPKK